jgi:hypothetical protein
MISPTDLFHPSPAPHFKTFQVGLDGRIILRWIFRKRYVGAWTGSNWLRIGTGGGHL